MLKKGYYKSREAAEAAAARIDAVYGAGSAEATRDVNYSHRVNLRGTACDVYYASKETFNAAVKRGQPTAAPELPADDAATTVSTTDAVRGFWLRRESDGLVYVYAPDGTLADGIGYESRSAAREAASILADHASDRAEGSEL